MTLSKVERVARQALRISQGAQSEDDIHFAIVAELRRAGLPCWHTPNEGDIPIQYRAKLEKRGLASGVPDLFVLVPSGVVAIEVKKPGGKPSPKQLVWRDRLEGAGVPWYCVRSVEEARVSLRKHGAVI